LLPSLVDAWRRGETTARMLSVVGLDRFAGFENRALVTPPHTAYVKIAEGCSRRCSFCAIPKIRGAMVCRSADSIVREVEGLVERGVKEVSLLSQDITSYTAGGRRLPDLVDAIAGTGIDWIRIFYVHPGSLTLDLTRRLFEHESVCRYLEVPVQHAADGVLEAMGRTYTRAKLEKVFADIRREFPDVVIRSEIIVGFPGETEDNFEELKGFVGTAEFASLGVFCYSPEPNTGAVLLDGTVSDSLKRDRMDEIADIQRSVSFGLLERERGRTRRILVDRRVDRETALYEDCSHAGRYYGQAYEIDGEVYLKGGGLDVGEFVDARITDSDEFDLAAEAI
jgi:ribosomal protein S12 methylthiotransferase